MIKRFDYGKLFSLKTLLFNNRLKTYKKYIEYALDNGYKVCSMLEFWKDKDSDNKHFVLRHDVDWKGIATRKMWNVEQSVHNIRKRSVNSTYYFRHSTTDSKLIKEMLAAGTEVGLHYETISDYAEQNGIFEFDKVNIDDCRKQLKKEISDFKNLINPTMESICSHGSPLNSVLGVSNNFLLENENYSDYGITFEAYDKELYEKYVNCHIMDGTLRINSGFSYKENPIDAINNGYKNIIFLAHPNHWYFTLGEQIKHIGGFVLKGMKTAPLQNFKRIATGKKNEK